MGSRRRRLCRLRLGCGAYRDAGWCTWRQPRPDRPSPLQHDQFPACLHRWQLISRCQGEGGLLSAHHTTLPSVHTSFNRALQLPVPADFLANSVVTGEVCRLRTSANGTTCWETDAQLVSGA